jgi:hypothetical protein
MMMSTALSKSDAGITIRYRSDGGFFDLRRLKAKTKLFEALARDCFFADDCALATHSQSDLRELADCISAASRPFGLTISP